MKKILVLVLLISMGQLCAMEAGGPSAEEQQWALEGADGTQIAAVGQLVAARENTGEKVDYWLAQLASFHESGCTNGQLRVFEVYFNKDNEDKCRAYFHSSHPVVAAAFLPALPAAASSASSPPSPAASERGRRRPLHHSGKERRLLGLSSAQFVTAMGGTAMMAGGAYAAHRHVKVRHAKGEKTVFDRMGQWIQQKYRRLIRSKKTTSEVTA